MAPLAITIDRRPLQSDVAPQAIGARVYVPARAIFTALGATVHYDAATGAIGVARGDRRAGLRVGSRIATVQGRTVTLDAPPRVVDARTLVPLRFIAEALGAVVSYDRAEGRIAIIDGQESTRAAERRSGAVATSVEYTRPAPGERTLGPFPAISAVLVTHGGPPVDPASLHVLLDGIDVTPRVRRSGNEIGYTPDVPLEPGVHEIDVSGTDTANTPFGARWQFTSDLLESYVPGDGSGFAVVGPYGGSYGNDVGFEFVGPPGGSGFVNLCGYARRYPFSYDAVAHRYIADATLPPNLYAPNCTVTGTFTDPYGNIRTFPLTSPIPIDTVNPPAPKPTPVPPAPYNGPLENGGLPTVRRVLPPGPRVLQLPQGVTGAAAAHGTTVRRIPVSHAPVVRPVPPATHAGTSTPATHPITRTAPVQVPRTR